MKIAILLLCVAAAHAASISSKSSPFIEGTEDCGSLALVFAMRVSGCPSNPCSIEAGTNVQAEVDFLPRSAHPYLVMHLHALIGGIDIDIFRGQIPDSGVEPGRVYTVANDIPADPILKGILMHITFSLYGHDANPVHHICKKFHATIV